MNWAHATGRRAFFLMQWHDTSHRIVVCRPAVPRSMLQAAKSWTDNQNNMNNTRHTTYNSLLSAEHVGFASLTGLPGHPKALLALLVRPGHLSVIARRIGRKLASASS
jgi:hypothetical protein